MFRKLINLLRKDVLLMRRSKTWTAFEILLPLLFLIAPPVVYEALREGPGLKSGGNWSPAREVNINDVTHKYSLKCGSPRIDNFENFFEDYSVEWNSVTQSLTNKTKHDRRKEYGFYRYIYLINKILFGLAERTSKTARVENFNSQLYTLPVDSSSSTGKLLVFTIFPLIFGICMTMPVLATARTLVTEKSSVTPYLSTIGLPIWIFYMEHFIFGVLKTTFLITLFSILWPLLFEPVSMYVLIGIFFYTFNVISFAVFFSSIFPFQKRIVEALILIWLFSFILPMIYPAYGGLTWVVSLTPNYALKNFLGAIVLAEEGSGVAISHLFWSKTTTLQCSAVYVGFMIFNTVWMLISAIFIEKLITSVGHFVLKTFWGVFAKGNGKESKMVKEKDVGDRSTILNCQEKLDGRLNAVADIELSGLVKVYTNGEKAVNGLSLRAIRGQVSILLGHNGCGKSTTFGMITGMHKATEGRVIIGGIDANSHRAAARKMIGYCPQYNPLYDKLTVMEHLKLVNALKGGSKLTFKVEADSLLQQIELTDKRDTLAKNLSGGMKRKLCDCMAMIGGSRVILLDEPTAGMDPSARIDVQRMLALVKADRTILLTTHYMDEAEKLGDWIFVMSHGKMAASGSNHYLKQKYGSGMLLTIVFKNIHDPKKSYESAYSVCKAVCSTAVVKDERGQMMEISVSESEKSRLPTLLKILEAITDGNNSTPEFKALGANVQDNARKLELATIGISMSSLEQVFIKIGDDCDNMINGTTGANRQKERSEKFKRLIQEKIKLIEMESLDLSQYPESTILVQVEDEKDNRLMEYLNNFPNLYKIKVDYNADVDRLVRKYSMGFQQLGFVIKVDKLGNTLVYYGKEESDVFNKKPEILMNLLASCMYLRSRNQNIDKLPFISSRVQWIKGADIAHTADFNTIFTNLILFALIIAGIIIQSTVYLIEERVSKFTHQQYLTGLSPISYWGVVFLWDFVLFTLIMLYTIVFVLGFGVLQGHIHEIVIIFYSFLLYFVSLVYLTASLINTPTKGSLLLYVFCLTTYMMYFLIVLATKGSDRYRDLFMCITHFVNPTVGFIMGIYKIAASTYENSGLAETMHNSASLWDFNGLVIELAFIIAAAFLFTLLLCCITMKPIRRACFLCCHRRSRLRQRMKYKGLESCRAVQEEEAMVQNIDKADKILVINGLIKDFGKFRAVNGLSVTVDHEECFGMLGANGAGKTTTFDIITGLTMPTGGRVTIDGHDISRTIHIGYCPQFDAMLQQISCRETLMIMAKLQGYANVSEVVDLVLDCVGMADFGNKLVKNCSGGQKRKISVGIALMSRATCIILDEPTAGIDPRARREIWDIIHEMREQAKCSIVLTSHSMEECEALCTRIGILRNGEMIALGTSQSLKSQYGNTYMMTLILNKLEDRKSVCQIVKADMPYATLKTPESSLTTSIVWEIPKKKSDKWSVKYDQVEALARKVRARDYTLTQASLEDTFILFILEKF